MAAAMAAAQRTPAQRQGTGAHEDGRKGRGGELIAQQRGKKTSPRGGDKRKENCGVFISFLPEMSDGDFFSVPFF